MAIFCRKISTLGAFGYKCRKFILIGFPDTKILKKKKGCLISLNTVYSYTPWAIKNVPLIFFR